MNRRETGSLRQRRQSSTCRGSGATRRSVIGTSRK
jgi:hypothetical protein